MMSYSGVDLPVVSPLLAAWVEKNISPAFAFEFDPSYDENQLACLPVPPVYEVPPVRPGVLAWPTGASRWAVFHTVVNAEELDELRAALSTGSKYGPASLVLDDGRLDPETGDPVGERSTQMTMLPPKPLSGLFGEIDDGGQLDLSAADYREKNKLYLLTLVDDRFWWWFKQPTDGELDPDVANEGTWGAYLDQIFTALGLATPSFTDSGYPLPKDRWHLFHRPLPMVLDAALAAIGKKLVRQLDGTVLIQAWDQAYAAAMTLAARQYAEADPETLQQDLGNTDMGRIAGGLIDYEDIRRSVPAAVRVVWDDTDDTGYNEHSLSGLSIADYLSFGGRSNEVAVVRIDDLSGDELDDTDADPTIWAQAANDWYGWRLANWDVTFGGIAQWDSTGWEDMIYWSQGAGGVFTRVTKPPVVNGAGRGMCNDGGSGGPMFFARISGTSGNTYGGVEIQLDPDVPDGWEDKPGGRTFANDKGHRAPSVLAAVPAIPLNQTVLAQASLTKPGHYMLTPWGGQIRVFEKELYKVCVRCVEMEDGSFKLRTRSVYRHWRRDARDQKRTLGLNTDSETVDACTDC